MSRLKVQATFGYISDRLDKVLLRNVLVNGEIFRDHTWVQYKDKMGEFDVGETITFNASFHAFVGLNDKNEYVPKKGFKLINNILKM